MKGEAKLRGGGGGGGGGGLVKLHGLRIGSRPFPLFFPPQSGRAPGLIVSRPLRQSG